MVLSVEKILRETGSEEEPKSCRKKNGRTIVSSNFAVCGNEKSSFIKEQEAGGMLGNLLGTKTQVLGDLLLTNILF